MSLEQNASREKLKENPKIVVTAEAVESALRRTKSPDFLKLFQYLWANRHSDSKLTSSVLAERFECDDQVSVKVHRLRKAIAREISKLSIEKCPMKIDIADGIFRLTFLERETDVEVIALEALHYVERVRKEGGHL